MAVNDLVNDYYNIIWKYFELHAKQRITLFSIYVTLLTFMISGLAVVYFYSPEKILILRIISIYTAFLTLVFWGFEIRNRKLVKKYYDLRNMERLVFNNLDEEGRDDIREIFQDIYNDAQKNISHRLLFNLLYGIILTSCVIFNFLI